MRTTPWTKVQEQAISELKQDGRIQNERPCGCFDVVITNNAYGSMFVLVPCDTCREGLTRTFPHAFSMTKES